MPPKRPRDEDYAIEESFKKTTPFNPEPANKDFIARHQTQARELENEYRLQRQQEARERQPIVLQRRRQQAQLEEQRRLEALEQALEREALEQQTGLPSSTFRPISRNEGQESLMDVESSAGNMMLGHPLYNFRGDPSSTVASAATSAATSTRSTPLHTSPTSEDYGADDENDQVGRLLRNRLEVMVVDDDDNTTGNIKKTSRKKKISKKKKGTRKGRKKSARKKKRVKRRKSVGEKRRRKGKKTKKRG